MLLQSEKEIETIKNEIENGNIRDQKSFDKWVKSHIGKQRSDESHRINAEDRSTNGNNDSLDLQLSEGESFGGQNYQNSQENLGTGFIRIYNNDGTINPRYLPINSNEALGLYITSEGEVYGFTDNAGNIQHEIIMKLTEEQKKISSSQKFWENMEKSKKQVELWQQQPPMSDEEFEEMMESRKAFKKKNS